jgi:hypothetical protein
MSRRVNLTRAEIPKCADDFHLLLVAIETGEMTTTAAMRHRLGERGWPCGRCPTEERRRRRKLVRRHP